MTATTPPEPRATVELVRSVLALQEKVTHQVMTSGPPWNEGWTLHMHPKTWYSIIRETDVKVYNGYISRNVRGQHTFMDIPIVLSADWPEQTISLRYEEVVLG